MLNQQKKKKCWMKQSRKKKIIKQMISNNKNKNSKELTLEEIIHKSKFRKNIDHICLLETKINKDFSKPASLVNTPISAFNQTPEIVKFQHLESKRSINSTHEPHRRTTNSVTARTTPSNKNKVCDLLLSHQTHHNNFKTIKRDELPTNEFKKSKQNCLASLQKHNSFKTKIKKNNQFLCVKGASGNIALNIPKPMTAVQTTPTNPIPEYEIKKYQTLFQLGADFNQKEKSQHLKSTHQTLETKKYHSFMVTKYSTSNNLRQRQVKSKSYSQGKFKNKIILAEDLIQKKVQYRGTKTEQKLKSKLESAQDQSLSKSKKMKKYELILNVNFQEELRKQNKQKKIKNEVHSMIDQELQKQKEIMEQKIQQELISQKNENGQIPSQTKKGFKGKKVKSTVQIKSRYFIPDFIKPSLDLLIFENKKIDKMKTEERQPLNKNIEENQQENSNRKFVQLAEGINGKKLQVVKRPQQNLNLENNLKNQENQNMSFQNSLEKQKKFTAKDEPQQIQQKQETNRQDSEAKRNKRGNRKEKKKLNNFQDGQICAWNQSNHKNNKLDKQLDKQLEQDLDF